MIEFRRRAGEDLFNFGEVYYPWRSMVPGHVDDIGESEQSDIPHESFFRLFMVPGMDHCWGGEAACVIDYLSYLEGWVEQARAPDVAGGARLHWYRGNMHTHTRFIAESDANETPDFVAHWFKDHGYQFVVARGLEPNACIRTGRKSALCPKPEQTAFHG